MYLYIFSYFRIEENIAISSSTIYYDLVTCINCNLFLGIKHKIITESSQFYFLQNKIVTKNEKALNIGIFGIKMEKLEEVEKMFERVKQKNAKGTSKEKFELQPKINLKIFKQVII